MPPTIKKFKLPLRARSLDLVPEPFRSFYAPSETYAGEFELSQDLELEDVGGLKSALGKERETVDHLTGRLRNFDGLDEKDLEAFKTFKQKQAEEEQRKAEERGEYTRLLAEKDQAHAKIVDGLKADLKGRDEELDTLEIRAAIAAGCAPHEASALLLTPHVASALRVVRDEKTGRIKRDKDGNATVQVVGEDGNPRVGKNMLDMSVADFIGEYKEKPHFAAAFGGTPNTGSDFRNDAPPGTQGRTGKSARRQVVPTGMDPNNRGDYQQLLQMAKDTNTIYTDAAGAIIADASMAGI